MEKTTQVVDPPAVTVEEMVTIAPAEEEVAILEEPGVVNDTDLANIVYTVSGGRRGRNANLGTI